MLPDVDLLLSKWFPSQVHHHGVTHTVLFVVSVSVVVAALVVALFGDRIDRWTRGERFDRTSLFVFTGAALTLGGFSHLFADMLSAPDISTPIEPFWPFFQKPWSVDLVWYNSVWINFAFLAVMVVVHVAVWMAIDPLEHRYRVESPPDSSRFER